MVKRNRLREFIEIVQMFALTFAGVFFMMLMFAYFS